MHQTPRTSAEDLLKRATNPSQTCVRFVIIVCRILFGVKAKAVVRRSYLFSARSFELRFRSATVPAAAG